MTTVNAAAVCQHLKFDTMRPTRWERGGYIKRVKRGEYLLSELDAFLAECSRNFPEPPTWHELHRSIITLLTEDETLAEFGITAEQLSGLRQKNHVAFIEFPGKTRSIRYSRQSLQKAFAPPKPLLLSSQAAYVLGHDTEQGVKKLVRLGALEPVDMPLDLKNLYVSLESLSAVLTDGRLPEWVPAKRWVKLCQTSPDSLVPSHDAAIFLGIHIKQLVSHLREKRAWFVSSIDGRNISVLRQWLDGQLGIDQRYSANTVAQLFDVELPEVWQWLNRGQIVCPLAIHMHGEHTSFLWEPCWSAIIEAGSSPHAKRIGRAFVVTRTRPNPPKLWGVQEAAAFLGCSHNEVGQLATTGELFGVLTPAGEWRFHKSQIKEYGRKVHG